MNIVAITLMRSGSKRFPNKCMAKFIEKPLYLWTVNFAAQLGYKYYFLHDYNKKLSNDKSVIELGRNPKYTGDQHKTSEEIKSLNLGADIYIFLQVTNPIRDLVLVKKWIEQFVNSNHDAGFAAKIYNNKYVYNKKGKSFNFDSNFRTDNGCDKETIYIETGNFYIFRKNMLERQHVLYTNNKMIFDDPHLIDIDTKEDLIYAEKYYRENIA